MKKIPNPTVIVGSQYKVSFPNRVWTTDGVEVLGKINPVQSTIDIKGRIDRVLREKTWLHEVIHGICKEMNLPMPEEVLDTFANLLYDTLTRNRCDFSQ